MRILFWNTHRNNINEYLQSLIQDYTIDILAVSEYTANERELDMMLKNSQQYLVRCYTGGCERIKMWANYVDIEAGDQNKYYTIQVLKEKYILCFVHLISDLHGDYSEERFALIQQIMYELKKMEEKIHSKKTIIIGDMNETPYSKGCLDARAFHGLSALNITDRATRKVMGTEYRKFYNPMWSLMGDFTYPPGTYYLNNSKLYSPMWYILDQVIISKEVMPIFKREELKIITTCSCGDLMDSKGHPDKKISDHFPIMCEIETK